jgi:hypothetical protein
VDRETKIVSRQRSAFSIGRSSLFSEAERSQLIAERCFSPDPRQGFFLLRDRLSVGPQYPVHVWCANLVADIEPVVYTLPALTFHHHPSF